MKQVELPAQIVSMLLQLALKTEAGAALITGFALGKDGLASGPVSIIAGSATLKVGENNGSTEAPGIQGSSN
jgi:hypothetical protein